MYFMTGSRGKNWKKPANLKLNGSILPWVNSTSHLGNELHFEVNTHLDCYMKRTRFIDSTQCKSILFYRGPLIEQCNICHDFE